MFLSDRMALSVRLHLSFLFFIVCSPLAFIVLWLLLFYFMLFLLLPLLILFFPLFFDAVIITEDIFSLFQHQSFPFFSMFDTLCKELLWKSSVHRFGNYFIICYIECKLYWISIFKENSYLLLQIIFIFLAFSRNFLPDN